jgi:hypothetical protein
MRRQSHAFSRQIHLDLCSLTPWSAETAVMRNKTLSMIMVSTMSKEQVGDIACVCVRSMV